MRDGMIQHYDAVGNLTPEWHELCLAEETAAEDLRIIQKISMLRFEIACYSDEITRLADRLRRHGGL